MINEQLRILDASQVDQHLDSVIRRNLCLCFPRDYAVFARTRAWHGCLADWTVIIEQHQDVIAHLGIIDRVIRVENQPIHVAGIQNVFVLPACRGRGLVDRILQAAMDHAMTKGYDFGLLFCLATMEKVYRRNGWVLLEGVTVRFLDDAGKDALWDPPDAAMIHPLAQHVFPSGPIHLQGQIW